jgi:hypothetical protein
MTRTDGSVGGNRRSTHIYSSQELKDWWNARAERMGLSVSDMIVLEMAAIRDQEERDERGEAG